MVLSGSDNRVRNPLIPSEGKMGGFSLPTAAFAALVAAIHP
jgi:hypothetical protein